MREPEMTQTAQTEVAISRRYPPERGGSGAEFREMARRGLPADRLKRLNALSPWRGAWSVALNVGTIAAAIAAALTWWHPLTVAAAIPVIAGGQHGLFVLAHEAAHYRLSRRRWLNEAIGRLCGMAGGVSMITYRLIHRLHHNHLYEPLDPDLPLIAGYPRGRGYLLKKLGKDLLGLTAHKNLAYFFGAPGLNADTGDRSRPLADTSPALRKAAARDRWLVLGFHGLAPLAAIGAGYGWAYLLLWIVPLVTVLQAILRLRALCEHGAPGDVSSPLTAARTNLAPAWVRWWLFPHHVNYHLEHHLYPAIPHYRLPECHRALKAAGLLDGAEVRPLGSTLRRLFADPQPAPA